MIADLYRDKKCILKKAQDFFSNSSLLIPKIGIELEFFLLEKNLQAVENQDFIADFISELKTEILKNFSLIYEVEKEQGASQIEIKTHFTPDLARLCDELENAKNFIKNFAEQKNLIASFASQPFIDDCGNALQFNISLHKKDDKNIFETDAKILNHVIAGLLENTNSMMIFLAPKTEDYSRFSFEINRDLFKKGKFSAPVNLSFGGDNRTCAIRLPAQKNKRLEYRVAAADADLFLNNAMILLAIYDGLKNCLDPFKLGFEQVFGNAFDEQYQIKNFCQNLESAEENFYNSRSVSFNNLLCEIGIIPLQTSSKTPSG